MSRRVQGENVFEYINEPIIINADKILTIIPQGESVLLLFPGILITFRQLILPHGL